MKRLIIAAIAVALIAGTACASTVKYGDIIHANEAGWAKLASDMKITKDTSVEVKDVKIYTESKIFPLCKADPALAVEFDDLLVSNFNAKNGKEVISYNMNHASKDVFPKFFAVKIAQLARKKPALAAACDRLGMFCNHISISRFEADEIIAIMNAGEVDFWQIDLFNSILKDKALRVVKIALRKEGKSFVAKKDKDGKIVSNPLTEPMKELTDSLNAPFYAGFNDWVEKYNAGWKKLDLSWLKTGEELKKLMDDILIDDENFNTRSVELRLCLGVEKFNEFVKLYNEGAVK